MVKDFWWSCEQGNYGIYLEAWDHLCLPKFQGELGFRKTLKMNKALLAKWGWALLNEDQSLCCKKNVMKTKEILKQGTCKLISDGQKTNIWNDPWVIHDRDFYPQPNNLWSEGSKKVMNLLLDNGNWDISKLHTLFDTETTNNNIKGGRPCGQGRDKWIWIKKPNGVVPYASIVVDMIWRARNDKVVEAPIWSPPLPEDWVKINCDVKVSCGSMCVVALARDHTESVLWVATNMLNFSDSLIEEVTTCLLAMETAVILKHLFVLIKSDSETVVKTLKGTCSS
uniref:RNase H type-1 domain-containing protein n=1 Tax=Cannabis sativa TaxID=3483 RepID=A0A803PGS2_CANSA